tara:strand:+ start:630 stop:809 length:180 start_codon:yes stop_codon:yes gene_type:complete
MNKEEQNLLFAILIRHRGILEGQLERSSGSMYEKTQAEIDLTNRTLHSVTKINRRDCVS